MVYTQEEMNAMKDRYIGLLRQTGRPGIDDLIAWLETGSDFFSAPASASYHGSYPGGLVSHSLNVYDAACDILEMMKRRAIPEKKIDTIDPNSVIIVTLLHDLCKTNFYSPTEKFWKDSTRPYSNQWRKYMSYEIKDTLPLGHGEKSVIMAQNFIRLSCEEMCAIRFHMGMSDPGAFISPYEKPAMMSAINDIPLVELVILSDHFASFVMEREVNQKIENEIPAN